MPDPRAQPLHSLENAPQRGAGREPALARTLDRRPIGRGIRERDADLDDVRAGLGHREDQRVGGFEIGISCGQEHDHGPLVALPQYPEAFVDSGHQ